MKLTVMILAGFCIDCLLGDSHRLPHPIRLIGFFVSVLDKWLRKGKRKIIKGALLVFLVLLITGSIFGTLHILAWNVCVYAGMAADIVLFYYCIAPRSLYKESMAVYRALDGKDLEAARKKLSMIVGRDTEALSEEEIIKAAVETVAENTSDGVIAPLFYMAAGGPVLSMLYKAVNTMDSMIGYHNETYEEFGKAAARLDDACNYIPSRLSALLMIACSFFAGYIFAGKKENHKFDGKNALRIWKRDRRCMKSPNSAQTESVCAGALRVRLAGDAYYFGKLVKKPYIGDDFRPIEKEDIKRANLLMYLTTTAGLLVCILFQAVCAGILGIW